MLDEKTWIPFVRSLEQCIENQNIMADIGSNHTPTTIFYGLRDPLIMPGEIRGLTKLKHVSAKKLGVGHILTDKYTTLVATYILGDS